MLTLTRPAGTRALWSLRGTKMSAMLSTSWMTRSSTVVGSRLLMTAGRREALEAAQEAGVPDPEAGPGATEEDPDQGLAAGREPGAEAALDREEKEVPSEMRSPGASQGRRVGTHPAPASPKRRRVVQDQDPSPGVPEVARTVR